MSKITHERMKAIIDFFNKCLTSSIIYNSEYYEEVIDYITQQEKQEKLLELYREYYKLFNEPLLSDEKRQRIKQVIETINVIEQIKELENDKK